MQEMWVQSLGQEDPLVKEMAMKITANLYLEIMETQREWSEILKMSKF